INRGSAPHAAVNLTAASTSPYNSVPFAAPPLLTVNPTLCPYTTLFRSPIVFDVVFSETVTGFDGTDVSFAGSTVGGTLLACVSGSGATYTVSATGMGGGSAVVASHSASAAQDPAGNLSAASTSTDNSVA